MTSCDVLIVGGGPAGSTCAWKLVREGMNVIVVDKARFPRDKVCAGWITPQVVQSLQLDVASYSRSRTFEPFSGFHVGLFDQPGVEVAYDHPVSFGIRRCEFDDYLLQRSGAPLRLGSAVNEIQRSTTGWTINGELECRMLVGAGGHFCPVARRLRKADSARRSLVTAVEVEFPVGAGPECGPARHPRLYFRDDLSGYGWCVRKGEYLNVGIGLVDSRETTSELSRLEEILAADRAWPREPRPRFHGHAYYLYDGARSEVVDDGVLLIGDAAGLAYPQSGEGIRPAIESGLMAAETILEARGNYARARLNGYRAKLVRRLGNAKASLASRTFQSLGQGLQHSLVRRFMRWPRFVSRYVMGRGFLHSDQAAFLS